MTHDSRVKALTLLAAFCLPLTSLAHPADVTPLRIQVQRQKLEFCFTFNLFTLGKMVQLDVNGDQRLDATELETSKTALTKFLHEQVLLRINDQAAELGGIAKFDPLWPQTESVDLQEVDRSIDVVFVLPWPDTIANVWMEFTGFPQLGELATIQATYEQGDLRMQVPFSQAEPDYLYDTGFAMEVLFQTPPKSTPWTWMGAVICLALMIAGLLIIRKPTKG